MTPEQLEEIPGIGEKTLERISVAVRHYFGHFEEGEEGHVPEAAEARRAGRSAAKSEAENAPAVVADAEAEAENAAEVLEEAEGDRSAAGNGRGADDREPKRRSKTFPMPTNSRKRLKQQAETGRAGGQRGRRVICAATSKANRAITEV